jgi:hypothetical protein
MGPLPMRAARALAVSFGGTALLAGATAAAAADLASALVRGRRPRPAALLAVGAALAYRIELQPWMRSWGATIVERTRTLPGDELVAEAGVQTTHAVTIQAPVEEVWPWLAQVGQDRGGFYSYQWLENLAGCELRNADRVHPEWQRREVGEKVPLHPLNALAVTVFEPNRALGLEGWGVFVLEPAGERATRLIARGRIPAGLPSLVYEAMVELPHFLMQRRMLLGIKARAETGAGASAGGPEAGP